MNLRDEILTGPKAAECAPFVVTNDMPKDPLGYKKDQKIADILNEGRAKKVVHLEVGDGAICVALGSPEGPLFIYRLRQLAATPITDESPNDLIIQVAVADQAVRSLNKVGLDVGDPLIRTGLHAFIGTLLTLEQVNAIKALAEVDDVITAGEVSRALRGPWE